MILFAMMLQAAAAPAPSAEAMALGRRVAESGALARLLPTIATKEAGDLIKEHPELTPAEQTDLRATATAVSDATHARLIAAMAPTYANALTVPQMTAIVAFEGSAAAQARRGADMPATMAATKVLSGFDFKGEVMKAFCAKTGKACAAKK